MADSYDIAVDFMDMTNDRRLWARAVDARPGVELSVGRHVELEVLPGSVESHANRLTPA